MLTADRPAHCRSPKIPVARGWYADTREQLLQAYAALGIKEVVVKPVFGAAGAHGSPAMQVP